MFPPSGQVLCFSQAHQNTDVKCSQQMELHPTKVHFSYRGTSVLSSKSDTSPRLLVSQGFLDMHLVSKLGQKGTIARYLHPGFYQICCFFTRQGNIKAIVAVYFSCFTHVCSQKHNLIHLRPDTIHTSKGCKNLNPDRGKIAKTQLSHNPLGENKHIFS